jgi:hypothetical protein
MSSYDKRGSPKEQAADIARDVAVAFVSGLTNPHIDIPASAEGYAKGIAKVYETMFAAALKSITDEGDSIVRLEADRSLTRT